MSDPFGSSKYSVRRAKHHIEDFKGQKRAFFAANPYREAIEKDFQTGDHIVKVKMLQPLPEDFEGIVFDAANNLRSALDQAIFALLNQEFAKFPFADSQPNLPAQLRGRCKGLPDELLSVIESFKPYKGGNDLLWALNKLCNTNKHATLTPTVTKLSNSSGRFISLRVSSPLLNRSGTARKTKWNCTAFTPERTLRCNSI